MRHEMGVVRESLKFGKIHLEIVQSSLNIFQPGRIKKHPKNKKWEKM